MPRHKSFALSTATESIAAVWVPEFIVILEKSSKLDNIAKISISVCLVIPDSSKEKPSTGTVMAIGQGAVAENGTITPMFVNVGDRVVFPRFSGKVVKVGDEEKTLIKQSDILGIIR